MSIFLGLQPLYNVNLTFYEIIGLKCALMVCRAEVFDHPLFSKWVEEGKAPVIPAMLSLYKALRAENWGIVFMTGRTENQRNITSENLLAVGYEGWITLLLRYVIIITF